jgi:hypothetical protein
MNALLGLYSGELAPLAALLKSPNEGLPALIRAELVKLIEGSAEENGRRLVSVKHPDLKRALQGVWEQNKNYGTRHKIASYIEEQGGLTAGQHEAAITAAMNTFELSRSRLEEIWAERLAIYKHLQEIDVRSDRS